MIGKRWSVHCLDEMRVCMCVCVVGASNELLASLASRDYHFYQIHCESLVVFIGQKASAMRL